MVYNSSRLREGAHGGRQRKFHKVFTKLSHNFHIKTLDKRREMCYNNNRKKKASRTAIQCGEKRFIMTKQEFYMTIREKLLKHTYSNGAPMPIGEWYLLREAETPEQGKQYIEELVIDGLLRRVHSLLTHELDELMLTSYN